MADISKSEIKKEIAAILKDADLDKTSSKKVRQQLEEKLKCDLSSRKKEIDDLVMEYVESQQEDEDEKSEQSEEEKKPAKKPAPAKKRKESEEEDESEEESEEEKPKKRAPPKKPAAKKKKAASDSEDESEASESGSDDDYRPSKGMKKKGKKSKAGKKKKGSDSDDGSDGDWKASKAKKSGGAKKGGGGGRGGYAKPLKLSPELSDLVGEEVAPRHEVVKKVWALIKERNLYDPKNKQFAICDDQFFKVFGVKRFRTFGMMKLLKDHFLAE